MNNTFYRLVIRLVDAFLWGGELIGEENLPERGPAVFIANHLDALGPIGIFCSIPKRMHTWAVGDMMNKERVVDYLNKDFTERQLHLRPPLSLWFSKALSRLTLPLYQSMGCIPVWRNNYDSMHETLKLSIEVLRQEKILLIFPEDNLLPADPLTRMNPFLRAFVRLGEEFYADTGQRLAFYPIAVHPRRIVQVGEPVLHNPLAHQGEERHRMKDIMETTIRKMYLQLSGTDISRSLTVERK